MDLLAIVRKIPGVRHVVVLFTIHQVTVANGIYAHQLGAHNGTATDTMHVSVNL